MAEEEKKALIPNVLFLARVTLDNWSKVQSKIVPLLAEFLTVKDGAESWIKPVMGDLKVNLDAALFAKAATHSAACLARDHTGRVVDAFSKCKVGLLAPELAEAMGFREAFSWIKSKIGVM